MTPSTEEQIEIIEKCIKDINAIDYGWAGFGIQSEIKHSREYLQISKLWLKEALEKLKTKHY